MLKIVFLPFFFFFCLFGHTVLNVGEAMAPHSSTLSFFFFFHSSTLAWKLPWVEEPGGLQSVGLQRVGHD